MATKQYTFTGPVRWAKIWPGQVDRKFQTDNAGGNWSLIMNLSGSPEQTKLYNALGLKNGVASEEDVMIANLKAKKKGKTSDLKIGDVTFRRNERHPSLGDLGSPAVLGVETGTAIGNDSICTATIDVYDYTFEGQTGFAARLVAVEVNDLVPYVKPDKADTDGPPVH